MVNILSLGAGVQSSTMALMASRGELGYDVDYAIFADTQSEPASVYDWLEWLKTQLTFPLHIVSKGNLMEDSLKMRISKKGNKYIRPSIPAYTIDKNGSKGIVMRQCTADYKIVPIQQIVRKIYGKQEMNMLMGISTDEAGRMKPSRVANIRNKYPLIELGMSRNDCMKWMEANQYPKPPRSACVFCPFHSNREWQRLKTEEPLEFQRAVEYEKAMQDVTQYTHQSKLFLHNSCRQLDTISFIDENQIELFTNECEGMCGV